MDGTVTTATYDSYYGNYVVIEDEKGYCTKYAHMDTLNVRAGQSVTHGNVIGTTGNTGSSTGSHLHIECLYQGEYYNPLFYSSLSVYAQLKPVNCAVPPTAYNPVIVPVKPPETSLVRYFT